MTTIVAETAPADTARRSPAVPRIRDIEPNELTIHLDGEDRRAVEFERSTGITFAANNAGIQGSGEGAVLIMLDVDGWLDCVAAERHFDRSMLETLSQSRAALDVVIEALGRMEQA